MKAVTPHALVVIGARQRERVGDEGVAAVERGVEAGDLQRRREAFRSRPRCRRGYAADAAARAERSGAASPARPRRSRRVRRNRGRRERRDGRRRRRRDRNAPRLTHFTIAPIATRWSTRPRLSSNAYSLFSPDAVSAMKVGLAPSPSIWPVASASRPAASREKAANFTDDVPAFKVRINSLNAVLPFATTVLAILRDGGAIRPQVVRRGYMRAATSVKTAVNAARMPKSVQRP